MMDGGSDRCHFEGAWRFVAIRDQCRKKQAIEETRIAPLALLVVI